MDLIRNLIQGNSGRAEAAPVPDSHDQEPDGQVSSTSDHRARNADVPFSPLWNAMLAVAFTTIGEALFIASGSRNIPETVGLLACLVSLVAFYFTIHFGQRRKDSSRGQGRSGGFLRHVTLQSVKQSEFVAAGVVILFLIRDNFLFNMDPAWHPLFRAIVVPALLTLYIVCVEFSSRAAVSDEAVVTVS